ALGRRHHHRPGQARRPRTRLAATPPSRRPGRTPHRDRGTPPTRRDSRATRHGTTQKNSTSRSLKPPHATHERSRLEHAAGRKGERSIRAPRSHPGLVIPRVLIAPIWRKNTQLSVGGHFRPQGLPTNALGGLLRTLYSSKASRPPRSPPKPRALGGSS